MLTNREFYLGLFGFWCFGLLLIALGFAGALPPHPTIYFGTFLGIFVPFVVLVEQFEIYLQKRQKRWDKEREAEDARYRSLGKTRPEDK